MSEPIDPRVDIGHVHLKVSDIDRALDFYCGLLGFHEDMHPAPTFAMLSRGDLRLVLTAPGGGPGGGQAMPDGTVPEPGGWNRFQLEVADLAGAVEALRDAGARFRSDIIEGVGGNQILVEDPSGNPVELFEPTLPEASLARRRRRRPGPARRPLTAASGPGRRAEPVRPARPRCLAAGTAGRSPVRPSRCDPGTA